MAQKFWGKCQQEVFILVIISVILEKSYAEGAKTEKGRPGFCQKKSPARFKMYVENVNGQKCELVIALNVAVFYWAEEYGVLGN